MEKNIIELLEKNIERIDITNEKAIESIKKAISLVNDEEIQNKLNEKLENKLNESNKIEENIVVKNEENKDLEFNLTLPESNAQTSKTNKNTVNVKVLILAGAIAFSGIVGGYTLANRPKNYEKDDISSSYSQSIDNNDIDNSEVVESNSSQISNNEEALNTEIYYNDNEINYNPKVETLIEETVKQMNNAGIEIQDVHKVSKEERVEILKSVNPNWGTGKLRELVEQNDEFFCFNIVESWTNTKSLGNDEIPHLKYAEEKNIDIEILNKSLSAYNAWLRDDCYIDLSNYANEEYSLYAMSDKQAYKVENLIGSIFLSLYNERGIEEYYYILDDRETVDRKNYEYFNKVTEYANMKSK